MARSREALVAQSPPLRVALSWADKLVEEYLLFRGFMQTHRAFLGEGKHDRMHEFQVASLHNGRSCYSHRVTLNYNNPQVDKIVEELLRLLTSFQYHAMMDLWGFLQERFFSRLQVHTLTQPRAPARPLAHTLTHRAHTSQNPKTSTRNPKPETRNHEP
jgi:hypothetical protein